jgi:hypothetical protein
MPIVFILVLVVMLYIIIALLLRHDLLLRRIELPLIKVAALVYKPSNLAIWQIVKLLPIDIFIGQLLDKRRHCGVNCGTIDLGA